ncbi:abortive infection family protein [Corynebacterium cystitidis]|uniref:abortive infection family protein n=1 Tax=Corynebacterium cystitidis TaxID=35757 RepID=UPI00211E8B23|nr:abortive infection family protein [Corynebacterium cystitidis]
MNKIEKAIDLVHEQANILITTGTGGGRFDDYDAVYQKNDRQLRSVLRGVDLEPPFPWRTLWEWHGYYSGNLSTYADRRRHIGDLKNQALDILELLLDGLAFSTGVPVDTAEVVKIALKEADKQISHGDPVAAVDRVHTALHGHLCFICTEADIDADDDTSLPSLMKAVRKHHPKFYDSEGSNSPIGKILNALSSVVSELNTIRNNRSLAHPNKNLVGEDEARLCVGAGRLILEYVDTVRMKRDWF